MGVEIENIKGVFADLDDGGLTDDEALQQIRDLVGANTPGTWEVTCNVRFTATVVADTEEKAEDIGRDAIGDAIAKIQPDFEDDTNIDIRGLSDKTHSITRSRT
jgi:hypothetical protein